MITTHAVVSVCVSIATATTRATTTNLPCENHADSGASRPSRHRTRLLAAAVGKLALGGREEHRRCPPLCGLRAVVRHGAVARRQVVPCARLAPDAPLFRSGVAGRSVEKERNPPEERTRGEIRFRSTGGSGDGGGPVVVASRVSARRDFSGACVAHAHRPEVVPLVVVHGSPQAGRACSRCEGASNDSIIQFMLHCRYHTSLQSYN